MRSPNSVASFTSDARSLYMPLALTTNLCCCSLSSGLAVCSSTVPATPPSINDAFGDLYTAAELINSDGYWSNSILRLPLVDTCSRPFRVENTNPPDIPRMFISAAWPPVLTAEIPGNRVSASAIDTSGNAPKSSADSCSDTVSVKRFWLSDWIKLRLKPVTSITSKSSSNCGLTVACASLSAAANALLAANIASINALSLNFPMSFLPYWFYNCVLFIFNLWIK